MFRGARQDAALDAYALPVVSTSSPPGLTRRPMMPTNRLMSGWVYILASKRRGTLYVGVTNSLVRRVHEHRESLVAGFTKTYRVKRLVHYEEHATMPLAIQREKNIKHWPRRWKIDLIEGANPDWRDLWTEVTR